VVDFAYCLTQCELQEVPLKGAFFTWTNKTIWSRIDRALVNCYWYHDLGLTQAVCIPEGLSDHTPIKIKLLTTPGPKVRFKFCDMWTLDPFFSDIITAQPHQHAPGNNLQQHAHFLRRLQTPLRKLHRDKYFDIHEQQQRTRNQLETGMPQMYMIHCLHLLTCIKVINKI